MPRINYLLVAIIKYYFTKWSIAWSIINSLVSFVHIHITKEGIERRHFFSKEKGEKINYNPVFLTKSTTGQLDHSLYKLHRQTLTIRLRADVLQTSGNPLNLHICGIEAKYKSELTSKMVFAHCYTLVDGKWAEWTFKISFHVQ